ncbi:hypothetical protein EAF04_008743 [Stromatinia cepivora]|nr:hypothetical protein EAF04_008743 [Stromatinia cepivora]
MARPIKISKGDDVDTQFAIVTKNDSSNSDGLAQFQLPTYGVETAENRSSIRYLTTMSILGEIRTNYKRGRLMLFEIARRKRPWASLMSKNRDRIKLDGPASELDRALNDMIHDGVSGDVGMPCWPWHNRARKSSKFEEECREMGQMQEELTLNDPEIKEFLRSANSTLLRLDKELRDSLVHPLKQYMVNGQEVNHKDLLAKVREIHENVDYCCRDLRTKVSQRQEKLMEKSMIDWLGEDWESEESKKIRRFLNGSCRTAEE